MKAIHYYYFCYFYPYIAPTAHRVPTKSHILFSYPVRTFLVYLATTIFSYFHCIFSYFFLYLVRIFLVYLATAIFSYFFVFVSPPNPLFFFSCPLYCLIDTPSPPPTGNADHSFFHSRWSNQTPYCLLCCLIDTPSPPPLLAKPDPPPPCHLCRTT